MTKLPVISIKQLLAGAAWFLCEEHVCSEDGVGHHGRRAAAWTILHALYAHTGDALHIEQGQHLAEELRSHIREIDDGVSIIGPGLLHRRNYSTNAIDCGQCTDAIYDYLELAPHQKRDWQAPLEQIALGYLLLKVRSSRAVHNQYLWAATGLARFVSENFNHPSADEARDVAIKAVDDWLKMNTEGYAPYASLPGNPALEGVTTYYHSRCLVFSWYVLELLDALTPNRMEVFLQGTDVLCQMYRPDGCKELLLETKRYYFSGPSEAASHSFDIWLLSKAWQSTSDTRYRDIAAVSLQALLLCQQADGSIASHATPNRLPDWQCPTMRTGHLMWLARVPESILETLLKTQVGVDLPASNQRQFSLLQSENLRVHIVRSKTPLTGFSGQRASGLLLPTGADINQLFPALPLQYCAWGNPIVALCHASAWRSVVCTLRHVWWHAFDCLVYKRQYKKSAAIVWRNCLQFFATWFVVRTEFCCSVTQLSVADSQASHRLTLANVFGGQTTDIGHRRIVMNGSKITVEDTITISRRLNIRLPQNCTVNGEAAASTYKLRGPCSAIYCFNI